MPELFIKNVTQKRREALIKALPDMLDLMVICTEAGSSLEATLGRVANEIRLSSQKMADEVELTGIELGFLPDRGKRWRIYATAPALSITMRSSVHLFRLKNTARLWPSLCGSWRGSCAMSV